MIYGEDCFFNSKAEIKIEFGLIKLISRSVSGAIFKIKEHLYTSSLEFTILAPASEYSKSEKFEPNPAPDSINILKSFEVR